MTNEQRMIVSALRAQGMGYGAIARKVGISENTVKSFCRRNAQKEDKPVTGADEHQCLCCGTPVAQNAGRKEKKFCSDKCRNKWWNAHLDKVDRRAIREVTCAGCGKTFRFMGRLRGSTAAMTATSGTGSEVARMSKEQMRQEKLYQATMSMVRKMLAEGLITEEEYRQIDTMFLEKYHPLFGTLFSEIC